MGCIAVWNCRVYMWDMCMYIFIYICVCVCVCARDDIYIHIANVVVVVVFFATPHGMWILVFQPGIESVSPALEAQNLNHWTIWKCPPVYTRSLWKFWWVSLSNKIHLGQFGNPDSFFPPDIKNWMIYSWWFFLLKHKNLYRELLFSKSSQDSTYTAFKLCCIEV